MSPKKKTTESETAIVAPEEKESQMVETRAQGAMEYAKGVAIKTDKDQENVIKAVTTFDGEWKRGEGVRKFFVDPLNDQVKKINALFKPPLDTIKEASQILRLKLTEYQNGLFQKAEAAKAKVMKQVEAGKIDVEKAVEKIENVKEAEKTVRSGAATVTFKEVKKVVIVDASLLPREFLIPDEAKIRKIALAGMEIPGVKIEIEKVPSFRSNP